MRERDNEDEKRYPAVSNLGQLLEPDTMDTSPSSTSVGIIDRRPSACLGKLGGLWPPGRLGLHEAGTIMRKKVRYSCIQV